MHLWLNEIMGRFLLLTFFLLIAGGLFLYHEIDCWWIEQWLGRLPGDTTVIKDGVRIYFPFTSAFLISFCVCSLVWLCRSKKKDR